MSSLNRPLRIAVADDDPRLREFYERALTWLGHHVVVLAADGEELVTGCMNSQPDLIITDMHMPRLNGAEAVERIWQTGHVPVIVMTGLPDANLLGRQSQQGPVYLVKPVPLVELGQAIARAVRSMRAHASPSAAEQVSSAIR